MNTTNEMYMVMLILLFGIQQVKGTRKLVWGNNGNFASVICLCYKLTFRGEKNTRKSLYR